MKPYILYSPSQQELDVLSDAMGFLMRKRGVEEDPVCIRMQAELRESLDNAEQIRMLVSDATAAGVLPLIEQIRSRNSGMKLVLVADHTISPVEYIRPGILPTGLLWRPLSRDGARDTLWDVLQTIPVSNPEETAEEEQVFSVEVRGSVRRIPYQQILFFEACNKRLNLHTRRKEIPFAGTLEKLTEELPEEFIRVHKSFIVNRKAITQIQFSQNLVILEDDIPVPISRTYKSTLKAVFG